MISESRIISMLQARDESALRAISEQYGKLCYQIAFRIVGNREDAEECVSDMLAAVWNAIPPDYPENLRAYLAAIVRRIAVNRYKQAHRRKRGSTVYTATLDELAEIIPSPDRVEQQIEQHELTEALTAWLLNTAEVRSLSRLSEDDVIIAKYGGSYIVGLQQDFRKIPAAELLSADEP